MKRSYSDEERAEALAALAANGGNVSKTARDTGVPRKTLEEWRGAPVAEGVAEVRHLKKAALADRLEDIARQVLGLLPGKLQDASVRDLNGTLKIATEAMQLLRGEPTSIHESREPELSPDERARRIAAVLTGEEPEGGGGLHPLAARGAAGETVSADVPTVH